MAIAVEPAGFIAISRGLSAAPVPVSRRHGRMATLNGSQAMRFAKVGYHFCLGDMVEKVRAEFATTPPTSMTDLSNSDPVVALRLPPANGCDAFGVGRKSATIVPCFVPRNNAVRGKLPCPRPI